jgi:imidazolonepropionase-like amidohydrolase
MSESTREIAVIQSTTLIDGRTGTSLPDISIVLEGELVRAVAEASTIRAPQGSRGIDGRGKWVIPGIVDTHCHDDSHDALRRWLALGITTIQSMPFDLPRDPQAQETWSTRPDTLSPRIQVTPMFTGGFPDNIFPGQWQFEKPATVREAQEGVRAFRDQGFGQIKIIQDDGVPLVGPTRRAPRLAHDVFDALVAEAHRLGMRVYVHAMQLQDAKAGIAAGADVFMHGAMDALLDNSLWEEMKATGMTWVPCFRPVFSFGDPVAEARRICADPDLKAVLSEATLRYTKATASAEGPPVDYAFQPMVARKADNIEFLTRNTRRAAALGVPIAVGSDGWPGVGTHLEMELMQEAGLSPSQVLVAATFGGATALGLEVQIGTIQPGKKADIVVLQADPLIDIRNARHIELVIKSGSVYQPAEVLDYTRRSSA